MTGVALHVALRSVTITICHHSVVDIVVIFLRI